MNRYEELLKYAEKEKLDVVEKKFRSSAKGLYKDGRIGISNQLTTECEKYCVLSEELGHYHTSHGDILDLRDMKNAKQEVRAREWAYNKLIKLDLIYDAFIAGVKNSYELAEYLGTTEEFLKEAIEHLQSKYGVFYEFDNYILYFEPFGIMKKVPSVGK